MASFQLVCALALFALVQVSSGCFDDRYGYGGYGYGGYGCGGYNGCGYGGYGYGCDCCCEPVTEITTVSCVPVVETFIEPGCGCYGNGYGYGGYGGYGYPGYGYGSYGRGYGYGM